MNHRYVILLGLPNVYGVVGPFKSRSAAKKFAERLFESQHSYVICDIYSPKQIDLEEKKMS
jgi:hypothetical protein